MNKITKQLIPELRFPEFANGGDSNILGLLLCFIAVKGKRPLANKELKEFEHFVETFKENIVQKWIDYFVYHKSIQCIKIEGSVK
jgi:hypothetical protein